MYFQITGTTQEDLHKQYEVEAESRTKPNLVVEAVAKAEGLKQPKKKSTLKSNNWQQITTCQLNKFATFFHQKCWNMTSQWRKQWTWSQAQQK